MRITNPIYEEDPEDTSLTGALVSGSSCQQPRRGLAKVKTSNPTA
ncbi:MAG: hypothetical protein ACHQEB_04595 [Chitinophagales bacterium]